MTVLTFFSLTLMGLIAICVLFCLALTYILVQKSRSGLRRDVIPLISVKKSVGYSLMVEVHHYSGSNPSLEFTILFDQTIGYRFTVTRLV